MERPYTCSLKEEKKHAQAIAAQLGYGKEVMEKIGEANSKFEVGKILTTARKSL